ncbi:MAG: hypothetical protein CVV44_03255 [Spirochaetae bacterium HGW-Spirochaetae-1]|nr:MAG: hypothetical protein CVV44_03255 [Spirochaetae bacterium HGW-Spirochaetae-1]
MIISLMVTGFMLYFADLLNRFLDRTTIQIMSTLLGIITISCSVNFIFTGIKGIFLYH